jgi:hypothetical protein
MAIDKSVILGQYPNVYLNNIALPNNYIQGEGTIQPTVMVVPINGSIVNLNVTLVANTNSPYYTKLAYKRRVTNTYTSGASAFYSNIVTPPTTYPTSISQGFWINDADVSAAFLGNKNFEFWYYDVVAGIVAKNSFNITSLINSIGNTYLGSGTSTAATSYNWKAVCLDKQNGYSFIAMTFYNIVYSGSFTAQPTLRLYHIYTYTIGNTWTKVDMSGMVLLFNNEVTSSSIYPDGNQIIQYPPTLQSLYTNVTDINSTLLASQKRFSIQIAGNYSYVRSFFNSTYDIVVTLYVDTTRNSSLNVYSAKLVLKTSPSTASGIILNGATGDDSAPTKICNSYMGGNHGNSGMLRVTSTAHGKTVADVGSKWVDGSGVNYYLLKVIDANTLWMISDNSGTASNWIYDVTISGNLTYVNNAVNTGTITVASYIQDQLLPSTKNVSIVIYGDNIPLTTNGVYTANNLSMVETYDIVNTNSAVTGLVANRPSGGYTTQPPLNIADSCVSIENTYIFQDQSKILIYTKWIANQNINLVYFGGTQAAYYLPPSFSGYKRYYPASLPISDGTTTWDFRTLTNIITGWTTDMNFTSAYWEDSKPVTRVVDLITNGTDLNINLNLGVVPIGVGTITNRISNVENAWFLATNKKLYPHTIDDILNIGGVVSAGTIKQMATFRGWVEKPSTKTNMFIMQVGSSYYILLDWHTAQNDIVTLPSYLIGLNITVNRKSSNVSISDTLNTGVINVTVGTSSPQYGYLELIIN